LAEETKLSREEILELEKLRREQTPITTTGTFHGDLSRLATKYGVEKEWLVSRAGNMGFFQPRDDNSFIDNFFGKAINDILAGPLGEGVLGGLPSFAYKKIIATPKEAEAMDELRGVVNKYKSNKDKTIEFLASWVGPARYIKLLKGLNISNKAKAAATVGGVGLETAARAAMAAKTGEELTDASIVAAAPLAIEAVARAAGIPIRVAAIVLKGASRRGAQLSILTSREGARRGRGIQTPAQRKLSARAEEFKAKLGAGREELSKLREKAKLVPAADRTKLSGDLARVEKITGDIKLKLARDLGTVRDRAVNISRTPKIERQITTLKNNAANISNTRKFNKNKFDLNELRIKEKFNNIELERVARESSVTNPAALKMLREELGKARKADAGKLKVELSNLRRKYLTGDQNLNKQLKSGQKQLNKLGDLRGKAKVVDSASSRKLGEEARVREKMVSQLETRAKSAKRGQAATRSQENLRTRLGREKTLTMNAASTRKALEKINKLEKSKSISSYLKQLAEGAKFGAQGLALTHSRLLRHDPGYKKHVLGIERRETGGELTPEERSELKQLRIEQSK